MFSLIFKNFLLFKHFFLIWKQRLTHFFNIYFLKIELFIQYITSAVSNLFFVLFHLNLFRLFFRFLQEILWLYILLFFHIKITRNARKLHARLKHSLFLEREEILISFSVNFKNTIFFSNFWFILSHQYPTILLIFFLILN